MARRHAGKYKNKHPQGSKPHPAAAPLVEKAVKDGRIRCADAHEIAKTTGLPPSTVGMTIDLLEYRITACQMGLFGHAEKKPLSPMADVPEQLEKAVREGVSGGRIPCMKCWRIAEQLSIPRIEVARACETMGIKIGPCQLGAF